jgi:uncharacterized protein YegP (UPF0339 family)
MKFVVDNGRGAHPTWRLYSGTVMVAWAGTTFDDSARATRAAESFRGGADTARYEAYQVRNNEWRWRARRSTSTVAYSGQRFATKDDAENAADIVRRNATEAAPPWTGSSSEAPEPDHGPGFKNARRSSSTHAGTSSPAGP